jgi:hypothetical protein
MAAAHDVARPPGITEVELHGIEPIPPEDRTATPFDLFRVEFGGANTFATVVLGAFRSWCSGCRSGRASWRCSWGWWSAG